MIISFIFLSGIVLFLILINNSVFAIPIEDIAEAGDDFGYALTLGDFNGDGVDDLAVGVHYEDVLNIQHAGAVNIIYGSQGTGLTAAGNQLWNQDSPGILGVAEESDLFGEALTSGDFNGDGVDDLAIGVPFEGIGNIPYAGAIQVIYGSQGVGLTAKGNQVWHQNSPGILGVAEDTDFLGYSLGSGDFNGDGVDDLAVGVPFEGIGNVLDPGAVNVIYGSQPVGLTAKGNQVWHQNSPGILGVEEEYDYFGYSFASGDFYSDGVDDLAIGARNEGIRDINDAAGAVHIINGSQGTGLTAKGNQLWHQDSPGILGVPEWEDTFGHSLARGDFDKDGFDDLAVGARDDHVGDIFGAGAVNVIYGGSQGTGLKAAGNQLWNENSSGIIGDPGAYNDFGHSLARGDFDGDGVDDLAVGVPFDGIVTPAEGAVNVIYGSQGTGLTAAGNQLWNQDSPGILGIADSHSLGYSLGSGDFNGDGVDDLAIGIRSTATAIGGAVNVIYGSQGTGLTKVGNQLWDQDS